MFCVKLKCRFPIGQKLLNKMTVPQLFTGFFQSVKRYLGKNMHKIMMRNFNATDQDHNNYRDLLNFCRHRLLRLAYK